MRRRQLAGLTIASAYRRYRQIHGELATELEPARRTLTRVNRELMRLMTLGEAELRVWIAHVL